jgi:tRNA dimethylallyltransferase
MEKKFSWSNNMLQVNFDEGNIDKAAFPPIAVLTGPTGVGKTALAIRLAQEVGAHIVNADSLQVYRELDIGTAKPSWEERALVPHHLVDEVFPDEDFDAAIFHRLGRQILSELQARHIPPLLVGGTGLYIRALLYGIFEDGVQDETCRQQLQEELATQGLPKLYERLQELDPETAARLHPNDAFRVIRALEVITATGRRMSDQQHQHDFADCPYRILKICLERPREELYGRIDARVEFMLARGLVQEVQDLRRRYPANLKPLQSLGYRHVSAYLDGKMAWDDMVEHLQRDTRRYAKRQLTWLRAEAECHWLQPSQISMALELLSRFFKQWLEI